MTYQITPATVVREYSAVRINDVVNHPDVRPWVGAGTHNLDLSSAVADPRNILLMAGGGGLFFIQIEPGVYEVHTQFVPDARGKHAMQAVRDALRWMFTRTDCVEVLTKVPDGNISALALVKAIGGEFQFHRPKAWPIDAGPVGVGHYSMSITQWARDCAETKAAGEWFHSKLDAAKQAKGATIDLHEDDEAHDHYVGATVEMILAGQAEKGLWFYNKWARFSGYATVSIIAQNPTVIDIQDSIIAVRESDFEVLLCR